MTNLKTSLLAKAKIPAVVLAASASLAACVSPVAGPNGLCGIITSGDVLAFESDEQRTTIEHLESYVYHNR